MNTRYIKIAAACVTLAVVAGFLSAAYQRFCFQPDQVADRTLRPNMLSCPARTFVPMPRPALDIRDMVIDGLAISRDLSDLWTFTGTVPVF